MSSSPSSINVYCTITASNGERVPLKLSTDSTATQVRQKVSQVTKIPLDQLRLIFRGKMIKDDDAATAVETYKLEPDCVLHCMGKPVLDNLSSTTTTTPASTSTATATTSTTTAAAVPSIPTTTATSATAAASITADPLSSALQTLRTSSPPAVYSTAVSTLGKILANIVAHPLEEKYRKVKKENVAFQKKLGGLPGGDAAMRAVGFLVVPDEGGVPVYQLQASPEAWNQLLAHKATIDAALTQAQRLVNTPVASAAASAAASGTANPFLGGGMIPGMPGGMPGMPSGAAMDNPMVQSAMAEMMSNPEAMRNMLQNPMVQQMIQNDPNVSPMLRNSMQQLASNPAMLNQLSQMMSDPAMRSRMQSMMAAGGGGMPGMGGMGMGGMPGMAPPAPSNPINNNNNNNSNGGNDQDQTEEEMIAEAIRRSLEEN